MSGFCGTNPTDDAMLAQSPQPPFNCSHFNTKNPRKLTRRHGWIRLHVPNHLQGQRIEIVAFYTDIRTFNFVFYTDTSFFYL